MPAQPPSSNSQPLITVRVAVGPPRGEVPSGASLRVFLLDDTVADAATEPVATVTAPWDGRPTSVRLPVPEDSPGSLTVFAHLGADPEIEPGDWITATAYPVVSGETDTGEAGLIDLTVELDHRVVG